MPSDAPHAPNSLQTRVRIWTCLARVPAGNQPDAREVTPDSGHKRPHPPSKGQPHFPCWEEGRRIPHTCTQQVPQGHRPSRGAFGADGLAGHPGVWTRAAPAGPSLPRLCLCTIGWNFTSTRVHVTLETNGWHMGGLGHTRAGLRKTR